MTARRRLVPGILAFAPATDAAYLRELQASASTGAGGVNVLRTLSATLDADEFFALDVRVVVEVGYTKVGLLSTRRTVESGRYQRAAERRGARVLVPPAGTVARIDELIGREAIRGIQTPESLRLLQDLVDRFADEGADAVILGCTDLMLFGLDAIGHGALPVVDSTHAHARAAARLAVRAR